MNSLVDFGDFVANGLSMVKGGAPSLAFCHVLSLESTVDGWRGALCS